MEGLTFEDGLTLNVQAAFIHTVCLLSQYYCFDLALFIVVRVSAGHRLKKAFCSFKYFSGQLSTKMCDISPNISDWIKVSAFVLSFDTDSNEDVQTSQLSFYKGHHSHNSLLKRNQWPPNAIHSVGLSQEALLWKHLFFLLLTWRRSFSQSVTSNPQLVFH